MDAEVDDDEIDVEANFRQGWHEAMTGQTYPIEKLWEMVDDDEADDPNLKLSDSLPGGELRGDSKSVNGLSKYVLLDFSPLSSGTPVGRGWGRGKSSSRKNVTAAFSAGGHRNQIPINRLYRSWIEIIPRTPAVG